MPRFRMEPLRANNVLQLFEWRESINLNPPYQRLSVWDVQKKRSLIDSVLNGFDIPKLYFHVITPSSNGSNEYRYAVIDGKQRLSALWEFMLGSFGLADDFVFFENESIRAGGAMYGDLMTQYPRLRARFDSFDVPVTVVHTEDEHFIEDLFARLNIQVPLSAPERRNALGGPLPYLIRQIGTTPFFLKSVVVRNDRLQHFDMAAKFLYVTWADAIESTKREALDSFVREFKKRRDSGTLGTEDVVSDIHNRVVRTLASMHTYFKERDPLLNSQGRITLYFHLFREWANAGSEVPFDREMLARFNDEVTAARKKSQRVSLGSREEIMDLESKLVYFDREKQSPNDAGALRRQLDVMAEYFAAVFGVTLRWTERK